MATCCMRDSQSSRALRRNGTSAKAPGSLLALEVVAWDLGKNGTCVSILDTQQCKRFVVKIVRVTSDHFLYVNKSIKNKI